MKNYGEYFKALREARGLTLRDLEKRIEVSNAYLSQLESGKVKQPSPITLHKLAKFYEVPYETLMEKVGYPVPENKQELKPKSSVFSRLGKITEEEELELLNYLKFIRNKKK